MDPSTGCQFYRIHYFISIAIIEVEQEEPHMYHWPLNVCKEKSII